MFPIIGRTLLDTGSSRAVDRYATSSPCAEKFASAQSSRAHDFVGVENHCEVDSLYLIE